jgi:branched-chain amino acid transport system permease protein
VVSFSLLLAQILTGLTFGMLYFLIAVGLSIILGVMNVVNLAHGSMFVLGAYIAFSFIGTGINFWLALVLALLISALIGVVIERLLLRRAYGKPLEQALLTFGLAFVMADVMKWIWGTTLYRIATPSLLNFSIDLGSVAFPAYRLFIVVVGVIIALILWYMESKTRIGAIIRAGVDDREMVSALGINVGAVFTGVFVFGAIIAALGGVLGGPVLGMYPGLDFSVLVTSLIVVVIGGLGSWKGSFVAAILVGLIETIGNIWFPALSMFLIFLVMILVLMIKPSGLFGRGEVL